MKQPEDSIALGPGICAETQESHYVSNKPARPWNKEVNATLCLGF